MREGRSPRKGGLWGNGRGVFSFGCPIPFIKHTGTWSHLGGTRCVQPLAQEHRVGELVVGEGFVDALGQERLKVTVVLTLIDQHLLKSVW
jgi:hypothetical protein